MFFSRVFLSAVLLCWVGPWSMRLYVIFCGGAMLCSYMLRHCGVTVLFKIYWNFVAEADYVVCYCGLSSCTGVVIVSLACMLPCCTYIILASCCIPRKCMHSLFSLVAACCIILRCVTVFQVLVCCVTSHSEAFVL